MPDDLLALAVEYHAALPDRIRRYLNGRGILDELIDLHRLGWDARRITVPICNREGRLAFFKLAKDPEDHSDSPKMLTSPGGSIELYGWERVLAKPCRLVICEGEFDRLVLESHGIAAVTSTGGAGAFKADWAPEFTSIPEVFVCFDRDAAGRHGARRVVRLIPHAKLVELPDDVGEGGDVTDFFVRLGKTREEFLELLEIAQAVPLPEVPPNLPAVSATGTPSDSHRRVAELKASVPIADVVAAYVPLRPAGKTLRGLCPFHDDHRPSLVVYSATGTYHCFGCGSHGDVISFLMAIAGLSFSQALAALEEFRTRYDRRAAARG